MATFAFACNGEEKPIDSDDDSGQSEIIETPTYHEDISQIIINNCLSCHQEGQIGPFPLDSYENVRIFGDAVADSVKNRRMPPFLADNSGDCNTNNWVWRHRVGVPGWKRRMHSVVLPVRPVYRLLGWKR